MKKTLVLTLLISALALSFTGCGTDKNDISKADAVTSTSDVSSEKSKETSEKATKKISSTEQETTVNETSEKVEETTVAVTTTSVQITEQQNDEIQNNETIENNQPQEDNLPASEIENNVIEETPTSEITQSTGEFTVDDLVFEYNGQIINLDEHINDVKSKIGEPLEMTSAPSCYYDGDDKSFIYDGFTIYTYPDGENDYVVSIEFSTDAVSTVKGARVGMAIEEALAIYGEGYSVNGSNYQYQIDNRYMYFYVQNGFIVNIGIVLAN